MSVPVSPDEVDQLHIWLSSISPMIWRRVLVRSHTTIADLHVIIQILFGWSDEHLHQFIIHGKRYGVPHLGGMFFRDHARSIPLSHFQFRDKERFAYEYDFGDFWQHVVRVEKKLPFKPKKAYPVCIGGSQSSPLEDCGGPDSLMILRQRHSVWDLHEYIEDIREQGEVSDEIHDELHSYLDFLKTCLFDREGINQRLQLYAAGDERWREEDELS
jgi:hypothetical protein